MKAVLISILFSLIFFFGTLRADPAQGAEMEGQVSDTQPFNPKEPPFFLYQSEGRMILLLLEKEKYAFDQMEPYFAWEGSSSSFEVENSAEGSRLYWHLDIAGPGWYVLTLTQANDGSIHVISEISDRAPAVDGKWTKDYASYQELLEAGKDDEVAQTVRYFMQRVGLNINLPKKYILQNLLFEKPIAFTDKDKKEFEDLVKQLDDDKWRVRDDATTKLSDPKFLDLLKKLSREKLSPEQNVRVDEVLSRYDFIIPAEMVEQLRK